MVFNNLAHIAVGAQSVLNLLDGWARGEEAIRQVIPRLIGLQTVTKAGVKEAGDALRQVAKTGFMYAAQSQIEAALRNISRELGLAEHARFYRLAVTLLDHVGLPRQRLDALMVPAHIRNSLHLNGIHRSHDARDQIFVVDGVTYEFRHEEPVRCADWEHTAHALETSANVVREIIDTPTVGAIPAPMMDRYGWDHLTTPRSVP